jgi:serine/threonine protein kinase
MCQAVSSVAYLHKNGFMHRDIKPENFLISGVEGPESSTWLLKLGDFGLAKELSDGG